MFAKIICLLTLPLFLPSFLQAEELRILHYNIKELDSVKLKRGLKNPQLSAALSVIGKLKPDFISINEIQFDQPNVPTPNFKSTGQNMTALMKLLPLSWPMTSIGFGPSNTGAKAKNIPGTSNFTTDTTIKGMADPVNFGVFPSEYSVGGATRFPVSNILIEHKLKWKDFRPDRDLSQFKDASGAPLDPNTVELFDKNFMDMTLKIAGHDVHVILLHTVPAHDFDIPGSPNSARNADQLSFLEWYLTGETDFVPPANLKIKPLKPGTLFVAMGDWNVDVKNTDMPGAMILQSLFKKTKLWMDSSQLKYTYESQPFYLPPFQDQLDYIITSNSPELTIKDGGVYAPTARKERGCSLATTPKVQNAGNVIVSYKDKTTGTKCFAEVSVDYAEIKTASDHRPLWMVLDVH